MFSGYSEEVCLKCDVKLKKYQMITSGTTYCAVSNGAGTLYQVIETLSDTNYFHTEDECNKKCLEFSEW